MKREELKQLVDTAPAPHAYFGADEQRGRDYLFERLLEDHHNVQVPFWSASENGGKVLAAASVQEWDARHLGLGCGRLDWLLAYGSEAVRQSLWSGLGRNIRSWCREQKVELLSCKIDGDNLPLVHGLEEWQMKLVDCELLWAMDMGQRSPAAEIASGITIEELSGRDVEGIGDLGYVFALDRFHSDYRLDDARASALWAASLNNACGGRADQVIIARSGQKPIGIVTCFMIREATRYLPGAVCDLVHVAVDPAWRGKGIGMAMLERAIAWASAEAAFVQVGTQARNYAANALYGKMGFSLVHSQYSMHAYWPL